MILKLSKWDSLTCRYYFLSHWQNRVFRIFFAPRIIRFFFATARPSPALFGCYLLYRKWPAEEWLYTRIALTTLKISCSDMMARVGMQRFVRKISFFPELCPIFHSINKIIGNATSLWTLMPLCWPVGWSVARYISPWQFLNVDFYLCLFIYNSTIVHIYLSI